jgi:hypothetical protein
MREWLLSHRPAQGYSIASLTLTVPGPPLIVPEIRKLWNLFGVTLREMGMGAVWRMEVQKRGAVHWHCMLCWKTPSEEIEGDGFGQVWIAMQRVWDNCLKSMGPVVHTCKTGGKELHGEFDNRTSIPGADRHAFVLQREEGDAMRWARYMQDHATKAKQEQIAQNMGRHWGVINKACFARVLPDETVKLSPKEYFRVLRMMQRLGTPRIKDDRDPFGRRAGRGIKRGRIGASVWFTDPVTVKRMIVSAKESGDLVSSL